jgi:cell division protein FtsB
MSKKNMTVVRNAAYKRGTLGIRERHNERKNECYFNSDVIPERAPLNVHFKECVGTYTEQFDNLLSAGKISTRGLKNDAKIVDELVFDVNSEYFEEHGGYEFAKKFYAKAYELAVAEVGGEDFILSAVLHADERNSALSKQHGRDVFHYHLHVVYVPVVEKEILWSKRCKDPNLVGTVKEKITQVSHSKKWPRIKTEKGFINSYSLLQDRFFEGMKAAGFEGFERGERGSTAEHLEVLDFKIQQDEKRLETLEKRAEKKVATIEKLDEKITVKEKAKATIAEVEAIGKSAILGGFNVTADELQKLKSLVKKGVGIDKRASEYKQKITALEEQINNLNGQISDLKMSYKTVCRERESYKQNYKRLWAEVKPFIDVIRKFPQALLDFIRDRLPKQKQQKVEEFK